MIRSMIGLSLALVAAPASANLVVNGGFESGNFSSWTQVNDLRFTGVNCEADFGGETPPEGVCQAFFGPIDPFGGGIIQTITTVAGGQYDLSFQLANLGGPPNTFGLFWDGAFVSIDFDEPPFPYATITTSLIASGTSTDLGFIFFHQPSFFLLDDVVLNAAIPEPATWALMIAGFGLAGGAVRRRKISYSIA